MRILKIEITGDSLYRGDSLSLDLYATDRVISPRDGLPLANVTRVGDTGSIYTQNVIGISGVNASGKTTTLDLLEFATYYLAVPHLMRSDRFLWDAVPAKLGASFGFRGIFWHGGDYYLVDAILERREPGSRGWYRIADEKLYILNRKNATKKALSSFDAFADGASLLIHRNAGPGEPGSLTEEQKTFLRADTSVVAAVTGALMVPSERATARLEETTYSTDIVNAFDGSVEYLKWDAASEVYHLKFRGEPERSVSRAAAESQLSYGTLIGSELALHAIGVLRDGGLMIVDEIEHGLNKSLVRTIIDLFLSPTTNPNGAQLVFTTHYPEILDFLPRKDDVYLLVRDADHRTSAIKYSDRVRRIENKKSEVVLSDYIRGTVPSYPDIKRFRAHVADAVAGSPDER